MTEPQKTLRTEVNDKLEGYIPVFLMYDIVTQMIINQHSNLPLDEGLDMQLSACVECFKGVYTPEDLVYVLYNRRSNIIANYMEIIRYWLPNMQPPTEIVREGHMLHNKKGIEELMAHCIVEDRTGRDHNWETVRGAMKDKNVLVFRGTDGEEACMFADSFGAKHVYSFESESVMESFGLIEGRTAVVRNSTDEPIGITYITQLESVPDSSIDMLWMSSVLEFYPSSINQLMDQFSRVMAPGASVMFHENRIDPSKIHLDRYRCLMVGRRQTPLMVDIAGLIQWSIDMSDTTDLHSAAYIDLIRCTRMPVGSGLSSVPKKVEKED